MALAALLCIGLVGCGGGSSQRLALNDGPPFGGPETEIVYSYSVRLIPPAGMEDWETRKVATLPSIHLEELGESGRFSAEQRSALAGKGGPSYIDMSFAQKSGYVARRLRPGRYAFVKVIDAAQTSGQGLVCFDRSGRPLAPTAVITLSPGATIYAGHVVMEMELARSADPDVLEASFSRLTVAPSAPDEDFAKMGVPESAVVRQPGALTSCEPWVFHDLVGRRAQCSGETHEQLEDRLKVLRGNRSIMKLVAKQTKTGFAVGPEQILPCAG